MKLLLKYVDDDDMCSKFAFLNFFLCKCGNLSEKIRLMCVISEVVSSKN